MRNLSNTEAAIAYLSTMVERAADEGVGVSEAWVEVTNANLGQCGGRAGSCAVARGPVRDVTTEGWREQHEARRARLATVALTDCAEWGDAAIASDQGKVGDRLAWPPEGNS
jgi:hypothetical protein